MIHYNQLRICRGTAIVNRFNKYIIAGAQKAPTKHQHSHRFASSLSWLRGAQNNLQLIENEITLDVNVTGVSIFFIVFRIPNTTIPFYVYSQLYIYWYK